MGTRKWWIGCLMLIVASAQLGCQSNLRGNAHLNNLTADCAANLAAAFGNVSEMGLANSPLGLNLSNFKAKTGKDSQGPYVLIAFNDFQGINEYGFTGPITTHPAQSLAKNLYTVSYRCLDSECFRVGVLINQANSGSFGYSSATTMGVILQQDDSNASGVATYITACVSTGSNYLQSAY